jgi:hypothetical protein
VAVVGKGGVNGSIVLAADDSATLATFYGALLEVDLQQGLSASHWRLPWPAGRCLDSGGRHSWLHPARPTP